MPDSLGLFVLSASFISITIVQIFCYVDQLSVTSLCDLSVVCFKYVCVVIRDICSRVYSHSKAAKEKGFFCSPSQTLVSVLLPQVVFLSFPSVCLSVSIK